MANSINSVTTRTQISSMRYEISFDTAGSTPAALTVKDGSTVIDAIHIDNSDNSSASYVRLYNTSSSSMPTIGTSNPVYILPCAANGTIQFSFDPGQTMSAGVQLYVSTLQGTAGSTVPSSAVTVTILTH